MIEIYMIFYNDGYQDVPLGGYLTLEEANEVLEEMKMNDPDSEHWISGPFEVDPDNRVE